MEFELSDEQEAVAEAAEAVFGGMSGADRVAAAEQSDDRFDGQLWEALARANLLGLAIPDLYGGSGLGMTELCLVLEAQGRAVAPVPVWATLVLGSLPIARFGSEAQKRRWLPAVCAGEARASAALTEAAASETSAAWASLPVRARREGGGFVLEGVARAVPQAHVADVVVVPARCEDETVVLLMDTRAEGIGIERAVTTDRQIHPHLHLEGVHVAEADVLEGGDAVVEWALQRARTGLCALALGVCEEAVRRTAAFLNERHQFGRPLSSFQATMLRAADAYIDTEAMRVTLWQAAWRLDTGREAAEAVAAAKWWASDAGQRVVHSTQHLHGGLGADVEYPIHRYFLWGKQIELMLGSPSSELARLGALLARRLHDEADREAVRS